MHINIIGNPRTGSQYFQQCLERILKAKGSNVKRVGELFREGKENITGDFNDRLKFYHSINNKDIVNIFKLFPNQFDSSNWKEGLEEMIKSPGSYNIFLFRENIIDNIMSKIIHHATGVNATQDPLYTDSISNISTNRTVIKKCILDTIFELKRLLIVYDTFEFDTVIKYEDFKGTPTLDFKTLIETPEEKRCLSNKNHFLKMNTLKNKKEILPFELIERMTKNEFKKANVPLVLPFRSTGLHSLNFSN